MHDETYPKDSGKPKKKKKRGNRTLTIIFYTLYCILILSFLAGLYFVNVQLEETLVQYEESHITVQTEAVFRELFADPDWAALYEAAGIEDTLFEGAGAFAARMEATVGSSPLSYEEILAEDESHAYLVKLGSETIGGFQMTDQREQGAKWPSWQLEAVSLVAPRDITVQIRKLDAHTVTVNGVVLDDTYTTRIDTLLAGEYTLPGTTGISTELQQVSGLLCTPEIGILDEDGNPCNLVLNPETGIYEEQLPQAASLTPEQERTALTTAKAWGAYKLRTASEGNLGLYFNPRENAYQTILSGPFWTHAPGDYTVESVDILASQAYSEENFSAYISYVANINGIRITKDATLFFELHRGKWSCYEIIPGSAYINLTKVRLEFRVNDQEVYYDFYETNSTAIHAPLVTVPDGFAFAGWGVKNLDGTFQTVFVPDETGYVAIPDSTVLEPMILHAIFEPIEGGN